MKEISVSLSIMIALLGTVTAEDANEKNEPLTVPQALKLGEEGLTQLTGSSEVGQDRAAEIYAAAKRLTTEQELGQKNLQQVLELQSWREVLIACRGGIYSLSYIVNGGGTMYTHGQRRDCSGVEDFLAEVSKRLPFPEAKGDEKAASVIDRTISLIKGLHADKDHKSELAERVKSAGEDWTRLKYMVAEIPAEDARKSVSFATAPLSGWLLNDNAEGKKYDELRSVLKSP